MPRVEMWENMYDDLISDRGQDAEWERACVCSCVSKDSGQPNYTCPICGGSGYRYLKAQKIRVVVTSFNSQTELEMPELREPGTAYVTPRDDVIMGYKDRLRFPNFKCMFSEVLRFSTEDYGLGVSDRTYRNIKSVVFVADGQYEYEEGIDFEVTDDRYHIKWLDAEYAEKLDGKTLSILYYTTPSYLVNDILHELRATMSMRKTSTEKFVELPKQYKLQREDFIYGITTPDPVSTSSTSESNSNEITVDNEEESNAEEETVGSTQEDASTDTSSPNEMTVE